MPCVTSNMRGFAILLIAFLSLVGIHAKLTSSDENPRTVAGLLTESDPPPGFEYALEPRPFEFPKDHSAHPKFRSEWWYFTGNVESASGVPFGFQLTLFRFAMRPQSSQSNSPWRTNNVYLGHFAVSDITAGVFHNFERQSRAVLDLAGARGDPPRMWIRDWSIELIDVEQEVWRLKAQEADVGLDLALSALRPIAMQGDRGLSKKSKESGNASYYYSIPRMAVAGSISTASGFHTVNGNAWFDHEWSTSALAQGQIGWDWFSLQLDNGFDLMIYQFRTENGKPDTASHGVVLHPDGTSTKLSREQFEIKAQEYWKSPKSGLRYPIAWSVHIPQQALTLNILCRMPNQEWHNNFRYWEGAVDVDGYLGENLVTGRGYVELVGYE